MHKSWNFQLSLSPKKMNAIDSSQPPFGRKRTWKLVKRSNYPGKQTTKLKRKIRMNSAKLQTTRRRYTSQDRRRRLTDRFAFLVSLSLITGINYFLLRFTAVSWVFFIITLPMEDGKGKLCPNPPQTTPTSFSDGDKSRERERDTGDREGICFVYFGPRVKKY